MDLFIQLKNIIEKYGLQNQFKINFKEELNYIVEAVKPEVFKEEMLELLKFEKKIIKKIVIIYLH